MLKTRRKTITGRAGLLPAKNVELIPETLKPGVKTTVVLPIALWEEAKRRAITERTGLRSVIIAALEAYLKAKKGGRS